MNRLGRLRLVSRRTTHAHMHTLMHREVSKNACGLIMVPLSPSLKYTRTQNQTQCHDIRLQFQWAGQFLGLWVCFCTVVLFISHLFLFQMSHTCTHTHTAPKQVCKTTQECKHDRYLGSDQGGQHHTFPFWHKLAGTQTHSTPHTYRNMHAGAKW